ncbi:PucR family transcriptional regulator [Herbiconiux ginsengi]|uniref:Purine catabolism regulatory protein n=1 Tax=Herbiconiux ginsengi TaxID=381665 RepID=A0A1H3SQG3_9MICO|nr:PucR family transcriptional regulator [Herbiconiux ginsengi]SDZ40192.1 purine catabolism regulatory protein [Herbiconiux ginsengi]
MPATLNALLAHEPFHLRVIVPAASPTVEVLWAHGSDLDDPTPFLSAGQLLLTTGRQFSGAVPHLIDEYVSRLLAAGVVALGFGTEVVQSGTPPELVRACRRQGLPLLEVPYRTPFIAISRWVADAQAADARARLDWALEAQRAVSLATLGNGGLTSAVTKAAERLGCAIAVFDPDADVIVSSPGGASVTPSGGVASRASRASDATPTATAATRAGTPQERFADLVPEVKRLLRAGRRSRADVDAADHAIVQTLGGTRRIRGVLVARRTEPFDRTDLSVLTTLTALAEVSLEQGQVVRTSLRSLADQLFELLHDGQVGVVRRATASIPVSVPDDRFRVVTLDADQAAPGLADQLERRAFATTSGIFLVHRAGRLVLLVDERRWESVRRMLDAREARAGVSETVGWPALDVGLGQAARALEAAGAGEIGEFGELAARSFLGLFDAGAVANVARVRLDEVLARPDGEELLEQAAVWLRRNGQWDPAARELGLHRHSLKARIAALGAALDLDLDAFADRAELWALLTAAGVSAIDNARTPAR